MIVLVILISAIPIGLSVWALLDAARRPAWAWALAERSQLAWLVAILLAMVSVVAGPVVAVWYLAWVRRSVRAVESGDLRFD